MGTSCRWGTEEMSGRTHMLGKILRSQSSECFCFNIIPNSTRNGKVSKVALLMKSWLCVLRAHMVACHLLVRAQGKPYVKMFATIFDECLIS